MQAKIAMHGHPAAAGLITVGTGPFCLIDRDRPEGQIYGLHAKSPEIAKASSASRTTQSTAANFSGAEGRGPHADS